MSSKPLNVISQSLAPQHALSRFSGWVASIECPSIKNFIIQRFIKKYQVDLSDAEINDPTKFENFNSFFTRNLKVGTRPIAEGLEVLASPCDGTIYQTGIISAEKSMQVKHAAFKIAELIGDAGTANTFNQGQYLIAYLAPKDYHRVHIPTNAQLQWMRYIPGKLFSVNFKTAAHIPNLFSRNERVVMMFQTQKGPMIVIMVGAMIVGSIHTTWAGMVAPSTKGVTTFHYSDSDTQRIYFEKGQEIGYFSLGSTVICLFPKNQIRFADHLGTGQSIRMGEKIGEFI
ncbi:MAG: archaetidylserine decarboxylase [Gammaproteobacteria bacterium]